MAFNSEEAIISSQGAALKKDASPMNEPGPNFSKVIIFPHLPQLILPLLRK